MKEAAYDESSAVGGDLHRRQRSHPRPEPPSPKLDYTIQGAIEVDTNENTLFLWHKKLYVLENIPCYYSEHAGIWDPATNLYPDNLLSRTVQAFSGKKGEYSQLFTFGTKKHLPNLTG